MSRHARGRHGVLVALAASLTGCGSLNLELPTPRHDCRPTPGEFAAGFGRADITPPPGLGLQGWGPEGRRARGYRHRLYARALVLQDREGERVAIVVADLPQVSAILHREAVRSTRLPDTLCIGADRLMLAATHTHAGPGHFFMAELVNQGGSAVRGYDQHVVDFLAERFAAAIHQAVDSLKPAVAAWGEANVWGLTRNRSLDAFQRNHPPAQPPSPTTSAAGRVLQPRHRAVDPTLTMLRVDHLVENGDGSQRRVPAGAFSVFAMHQTGNPSPNDLFDGDVFALAERGLERHIDTRNGHPRLMGAPRATALFANGTEGDVSPDWPDARTCPVPHAQRIRRASGPRAPPPPTAWNTGRPNARAFCIDEARQYVDFAGQELARHSIALFESLAGVLSDNLAIGRAFETLELRENRSLAETCDIPKAGTATIGGGADGRTRFYQWKIFGFIPVGFEEGGAAISDDPTGCHGSKRPTAGLLQGVISGRFGFPHVAQLMVIQVGDRLVGAVPWEVTTTAGFRIKDAMVDAAQATGQTVGGAVLVGLSNGYLQYLTTPEEYTAQRYEGGSNIYGPRTSELVTAQLATLARAAVTGAAIANVEPITARPGRQTDIFPRPDKRSPPTRVLFDPEFSVNRDTVRVSWVDAYPGDLLPASGPILRIERRSSSGPRFLLWDDDRRLEIRALEPRGSSDYTWELTWTGCQPGVEHRIVLASRAWKSRTLGEVTGNWFDCS